MIPQPAAAADPASPHRQPKQGTLSASCSEADKVSAESSLVTCYCQTTSLITKSGIVFWLCPAVGALQTVGALPDRG